MTMTNSPDARKKSKGTYETDETHTLDELSLTQALLDFEIANARVIDLTHRLVEANRLIGELRQEVDDVRMELSEMTSLHERMQGSHAFRIASKIWALRNAVRG